MVLNVHERTIDAPIDKVGTLLDTVATRDGRLWPSDDWPAMRLDGPLAVGAVGGHGPVRYFVTEYEPGRRATFQFTGPSGFIGHHSLILSSASEASTTLRHELVMSARGTALITWPLFFRSLHNALIEELFDHAETECGTASGFPSRRTLWARILRATFSR